MFDTGYTDDYAARCKALLRQSQTHRGEMRELIEVLAHERSVRKMTMAEDMIKAPSHHACDADEDKNGDDSLARGFDAARPRAFSRRCPKVAGGHRVGDR